MGAGGAAHLGEPFLVHRKEGGIHLPLCDGGLYARAALGGAHQAEAEEGLDRFERDDRLLRAVAPAAFRDGHLDEEFEGLDDAEEVGEDIVGRGLGDKVAGVAGVRRRRGPERSRQGGRGAVQDRVMIETNQVQQRVHCGASCVSGAIASGRVA